MPILNAVKSAPDARDYQFIPQLAPQPETDLREFNRDIEDQELEGSCSWNGVSNAIEIVTQRAGQWENLSRQFGYYNTRAASGLLGQEGVYSIRDALETFRKTGVCLESEWPYLASNENVIPSVEAYLSGLTRRISRYEAIDISKSMLKSENPQLGIDNINSALAEGLPVITSMTVGTKFMQLKGPLEQQEYYPVDLPFAPDTGNKIEGLHVTVFLGNSSRQGGYWIQENSWSKFWGDNGYGRVPYNCIRDMSEAYIIRGYKDLDFTNKVLYEAQMKFVMMYVAVLGRAPELSGFKWWMDVIMSGLDTFAGAAQGFLMSEESRSRFSNNGAIICDILYSKETFENRVAVAAYVVLDLACDKLEVCQIVLSGVTADPASVEIARKRARSLISRGVL